MEEAEENRTPRVTLRLRVLASRPHPSHTTPPHPRQNPVYTYTPGALSSPARCRGRGLRRN